MIELFARTAATTLHGCRAANSCFAAALLALLISTTACGDERSVPRLTPVWRSEFGQQYEAEGVCLLDGFIYVGTGGAASRIAKLSIATGEVQWTCEPGQTYQPSYPVSNGKLVVFGQYHTGKIIGLDDATGEKRWEAQALKSVMSAGAFHDDLVLIGSYDNRLYAIEWATGRVRWKTRLGEKIWSRPCVVGDRAFVACYDRYLWGINLSSGKMETVIECAGRIQYDPVASHGLIFLAADQQWVTDPYDSNKLRRVMTIIDIRTGKIVDTLTSDTQFAPQIVQQQDVVYFWDFDKLYAYDAVRRKHLWTAKAPPQMRPCPILAGNMIALAMNHSGVEGQHDTLVLALDRETGKELSRSATGGIGMHSFDHYRQAGDLLLTTDRRLVCYKITSGATGDPAP
jgi:outer membrane protein assembly factor BamB